MDDDFFGAVVGWLVLGGIFFVVMGWNDDGWVGTARYAVGYKVPLGNVHFSPKPYDCDWGSAPIGSKHCSYEAVVTAYNAKGELVAGKTPGKGAWEESSVVVVGNNVSARDLRDLKVRRVEVGWMKMAD